MNLIEENKAAVLIDGQWGSTGKGLLAAFLAMHKSNEVKVATTNASANAGHTTVLADDSKFVTYHLPTFAVMQPNCYAYLNAGSIIDPDLLMKEIETIGFNEKKLLIHPHAAVITDEDKEFEKNPDSANTKISSTQKGVGTALANKIKRSARLAKDHPLLHKYIRAVDLNKHTCIIEVPQGFDLSLNSGFLYPYTTSREITIASALSDAGIHPKRLGKIVMSCRTFPIRVGNIKDENGVEMGTSGPFYDDQEELTWDALGLPEEVTTVTKRVRRVFTFSPTQYKKALKALRPDIVFINFMNYLRTEDQWDRFSYIVSEAEIQTGVMTKKLWGIGPRVDQVFENYAEAKYAHFNGEARK